MQQTLIPAGELNLAPSNSVSPGVLGRVAILGAICLAEKLIFSVWFSNGALKTGGLLASFVHSWGAILVRLGIAIVLGSLIFAGARAKTNLVRISSACAEFPVQWHILGLHLAALIAFFWLSSIHLQSAHSAAFSNTIVVAWVLTAVGAFALAALTLIRLQVWIDILQSTGDAWIYGISAGLAAWGLGIVAQRLWLPLSRATLDVVAILIRPFVTLVINPATMTIGGPSFSVDIAPACSGYEGMGMMLAFSSAWLWFFRRQWRFPQALLLIPGSLVVIWFANAARIAGLILIGNAGAPQVAIGGFHSQAGWIAFNLVAIGTCLFAQRIPALVRQQATEAVPVKSNDANPTAAYLIPFLAILAASMVSRAMSSDFEWFYPLRVVSAAGALWYFRRAYRDVDWRFGWVGAGAGTIVFAVWMALEPRASSSAPAALMNASSFARIAWIAFRIIGGVILVPIAEELAFRGYLLRRLVSADFECVGWRNFAWAPFLISSITFGILHGERWLAGTIAGAIFALAQFRRGRIGDAIAAHSVANALVAMCVLASGNWNLW